MRIVPGCGHSRLAGRAGEHTLERRSDATGADRANIGYSKTPIALRFAVIRTAGYP